MFATTEQLDARIGHVAAAPSDVGTVELVVARPAKGERTVLDSAELRPGVGLVGDNYLERGSSNPGGGPADPLGELNLMSARALEAVAGAERDRWPLAGDQLIVDFDLSEANCPTGTRLAVGTAIIEVTSEATQRMRQVRRPLWHRRRPLDQLAQGSPTARHLCGRGRGRHGGAGRHDSLVLTFGSCCVIR